MTEALTGEGLLTIEQLLAADDREEAVIDVPEWGGKVKIKALSLGGWQDAMTRAEGPDGKPDENKAALYTLLEGVIEPAMTAEHYEALRQKSVKAITRVMKEIGRLSKTDEASATEAEARFPETS